MACYGTSHSFTCNEMPCNCWNLFLYFIHWSLCSISSQDSSFCVFSTRIRLIIEVLSSNLSCRQTQTTKLTNCHVCVAGSKTWRLCPVSRLWSQRLCYASVCSRSQTYGWFLCTTGWYSCVLLFYGYVNIEFYDHRVHLSSYLAITLLNLIFWSNTLNSVLWT